MHDHVTGSASEKEWFECQQEQQIFLFAKTSSRLFLLFSNFRARFPRDKVPYLVPGLRISGEIPSLLNMKSWCAQEKLCLSVYLPPALTLSNLTSAPENTLPLFYQISTEHPNLNCKIARKTKCCYLQEV